MFTSKGKVRHEILKIILIVLLNIQMLMKSLWNKATKWSNLRLSQKFSWIKSKQSEPKIIWSVCLGADSVIDLDGEPISKPENREQVFNILKKQMKMHNLISSVCISKNDQW